MDDALVEGPRKITETNEADEACEIPKVGKEINGTAGNFTDEGVWTPQTISGENGRYVSRKGR